MLLRSHFVGETGFEPATPWSQTRCATGLRNNDEYGNMGCIIYMNVCFGLRVPHAWTTRWTT